MKVLRERSGDASPRVTHMELFFDLVYVFAINLMATLVLVALAVGAGIQEDAAAQ